MLVPLDADVEDVQTVIEDLHAACAETNIQLAGDIEKTESEAHNSFGDGDWAKTEKRQAVKPRRIDYDQRAAYEGSSIIASDFREKYLR